jgi:hypothetical protein
MLSQDQLDLEGVYDGNYLITDEPIAPEDVVSLLGSFPFDATSSAFVFTILEQYGDVVAGIVNPKFARDRSSWHRGIRGSATLSSAKEIGEAESAFIDAFCFNTKVISDEIVSSITRIKYERNVFAHEGQINMSFDEFYRRAISVICYIFLMLMPEGEILIVHHTDDLSGRFSDAEDFRKRWIKEIKKLAK